jgi:hypothetical protein
MSSNNKTGISFFKRPITSKNLTKSEFKYNTETEKPVNQNIVDAFKPKLKINTEKLKQMYLSKQNSNIEVPKKNEGFKFVLKKIQEKLKIKPIEITKIQEPTHNIIIVPRPTTKIIKLGQKTKSKQQENPNNLQDLNQTNNKITKSKIRVIKFTNSKKMPLVSSEYLKEVDIKNKLDPWENSNKNDDSAEFVKYVEKILQKKKEQTLEQQTLEQHKRNTTENKLIRIKRINRIPIPKSTSCRVNFNQKKNEI